MKRNAWIHISVFSLPMAFLDPKSHQHNIQHGAKIKEKTIPRTTSKTHEQKTDSGGKIYYLGSILEPKTNRFFLHPPPSSLDFRGVSDLPKTSPRPPRTLRDIILELFWIYVGLITSLCRISFLVFLHFYFLFVQDFTNPFPKAWQCVHDFSCLSFLTGLD